MPGIIGRPGGEASMYHSLKDYLIGVYNDLHTKFHKVNATIKDIESRQITMIEEKIWRLGS